MKLTRREFLHASAFSALGAVAAGLMPGATAYAEGGIKSSAKPLMAVQQIMLGTLTGTEEKAVQTLNAVKEAGFEGIELNDFMLHPTSFSVKMMTKLAGMPIGNGGKLDWPALIAGSGLKVPSLHHYLNTMEDDPDTVLTECETFHTDTVVLTGMYRYDYRDLDSVKALAQRLNAAGKRMAEGGVQLLYHNHNCEFLRMADGRNAYQVIQEETDPLYVNFEFDSYWCAECGADPVLEMERLGDRLKLHHINDRGSRQKGASMTPILKSDAMELGTGAMPLKELIALDEAVQVRAVVLETHQNWVNDSPLDSIRMSGNWLKENL